MKCDAETNPPEVVDAGQLVVEIGIAPVKPAEFVVFRIAQFSGGAGLRVVAPQRIRRKPLMAKGLPNLPSDALASYLFAIEIDRIEIAQFSEVSGLASEVDVIELKENTRDGKLVIHKAPGAVKPATITLKRAKNASKALWHWHEAIMQGKLGEPGATAR